LTSRFATSTASVGITRPCVATGVSVSAIAPAATALIRGGISRDEKPGASANSGPTRAATRTNATSCDAAISGSWMV
jgi:hypothetical protein